MCPLYPVPPVVLITAVTNPSRPICRFCLKTEPVCKVRDSPGEDQQAVWETPGPAGPALLTLHRASSPPRMTSPLLISLVSCLVAVDQASLIGRCDLAKVLHQEDLDGFEGYSLTDWLCLAFVESDFNITKVNENTDGSFDYGIFQINSHYWCNDYQSHTENNCQVDCQGLAGAPGWERTAEPQSSRNYQLCKKDCVRSGGDEELVRRSLWDEGKMEVALCRPAPLLLDDRLSPGMRQGAGLWWSHSRTLLLTREFFSSSSSCLHFMLFSSLPIYK
ncbi:hypothetical protein R6Z07M_010958 [Ovis aries]